MHGGSEHLDWEVLLRFTYYSQEVVLSLNEYLCAAPKAELHVHLEGSIQPTTLLELAHRNRVDLPADTVDDLRNWFTFRDFPHFAEIYVAITRCLKTVDDYELIAYEFGAEMARQNV